MLGSDLLPILPAAPAAPALAAAVTAQPGEVAEPAVAAILQIHAASPPAVSGSPRAVAHKAVTVLTSTFEVLHDKTVLLQQVSLSPAALPSGAAEVQPASRSPALAAIRPLDFAALVDRLVQARDAAASQSVSLALTHTEFGKVSLRFEQGDAGLNVVLSSPDPDFVRAVSIAAAPERAAIAEQQQGTSQTQSSRYEVGNSETSSQSRGANPERRDDRSGARQNPAQTPRRSHEQPGRNGIFA